jgi:ketosteroid isomerase-like protein
VHPADGYLDPTTQVADHVAIRDLIERLDDATNHHEWERIPTLYTDDAVWEALPPIEARFEGRAAIWGRADA